MNEILKKLIFVFALLAFISCKKNEVEKIKTNNAKDSLVLDGRNLIKQNSNVLIDSVESFDLRFLVKNNKEPKFTVALLDSISVNGNSIKLENKDLINYKSPYQLHLVKKNKDDGESLFIAFSKFRIDGDRAFITVKKVFGISMMQATFYFRKENGIWIFQRKENSGAIG
jgi:hypothetical protein